MNRVILLGNLSSDIYYDRLRIAGKERYLLRLLLYTDRPLRLRGLRVVLWDDLARLYFPYLNKGSEVAVVGGLTNRRFRGQVVTEVEAEHLVLLRNIDWEHGETMRQAHGLSLPEVNGNRIFLVGTVQRPQLRWVARRSDGQEYALLQMGLIQASNPPLYLKTWVRGALAELAAPYLRDGSLVAADGHLQSDRQGQAELNVHHLTFLANVDWERGTEAAQRLMADHTTALSDLGGHDGN